MEKQKSNQISRRRFTQAAAASALAAPIVIPSSALGKDGAEAPSNRIVLGSIGVGGMGRGNTGAFLGMKEVQVVAVCDVDANNRKRGADQVNKRYKNKDCKQYNDFRELTARKDIDAVLVATPDHWHALNTIYALKNGKDVYCQKPITHTFAEGQAVYKTAAKYKRVFQVGSQQRSSFNFRHGVELVINGHIGKLKHVEVGLPRGNKNPPAGKVENPPAHLDYNFWCGPSKKLPYMSQRLHFHWRWNLNYGGGQLMDWIGHHNDIAHWGMGMDDSGPVEVEAKEFNYPKVTSCHDAPYDYMIHCKYANGVTSTISNRNRMGTKWIGEDGWVFVDRGKFHASEKEWTKSKFNRGPKKAYYSREHHRNFIDSIKSRKPCICTAEIGHRSITPGHLGYVSSALGRKIKWDPKNEKIIGDHEAYKHLMSQPARKPWSLSSVA